MDGLERELADKVQVLRLDILDRANRSFLDAHRVSIVPTFLLLDSRGEVKLRVAARPPAAADVLRALE